MKIVASLFALVATASAIELTPETWDSEVAGKSVFIKFLAPWYVMLVEGSVRRVGASLIPLSPTLF
jgi:hypothetical protein